jgi:hypothetical protein
MANTVTALSYANTFGQWMTTTNALVGENNVLGKADYTKDSGTLFLNETTQNSLQSNGSVVIQKELRVQGLGSSATIQNNLGVAGQAYFSNNTLSISTAGTANISGVLYALAPNTALQVSNNALIQGNASIVYGTYTNTLQANAKVNTANASITGTTWTNTLQANTNVLTGVLNSNTKIYTNSIVSNTDITTAFFQADTISNTQTLTVTQSAFANLVQANTSVNTATLSVTGTSFTKVLQANTSINTQSLSVTTTTFTDVLQANTSANTRNLSVTGTAISDVVVANTVVYTPVLQANASVNTQSLSVTSAITGNNITANTRLTTPNITVTAGGKVDANSSNLFVNNIQTLGQLSVGGNFVINGTTVYNSNTFTINSGSATGQISTFNVNRGSSGANATIRWNEPSTQFELNDVSSGTYYRVLTNQHLTDNLTSSSTTSVATANMANYLNNTITSANVFLQSAVITTGSYANAAFLQANGAFAAANNVAPQIEPAFSKANSSYARANTSSNTFVGTSGVVNPASGSISLTSNNGLTIVATAANTLAISTSQDLRTSASPTFNSLTLTNPLALAQGGTGATSSGAALTALLPTGTSAGYVLTTGGPGSFYWAAGSGGGGGATPGTSINSTRTSYTANGASGFTGNTYNTPVFTSATQVRTYINGVRQFESEYTLNQSANTVSFTSTPSNGDKVLVEVDGYYVNPYYANNISYGPVTGSIPSSANTIQLAIDSLESRKAALVGASFTGTVTGLNMPSGTANTAFATTSFVSSALNVGTGVSYTHSITGSAGSATNAGYATTAGSATNATYATSAGSSTNASAATNATYATSAGSATNAGSAGYATSAGSASNAGYAGVSRRLARSDSAVDSYNVQSHWDGVRWQLKGYNDSTYHAGVRVDYADSAGSAGSATNASSATYAGYAGNSGTVAGLAVASGRNSAANQIVRTDGSGYIQAGYINSSSGNENNASNPARVWGTNGSDDYMRTYQVGSLSVGSAQYAVSSTNASYAGQAAYLQGGAASSSGWARIGNGSIIQWGYCTWNTYVTFPVEFPNALTAVTLGLFAGNGIPRATGYSTTSFFYESAREAGSVAYYIAVGY